MGKTEQELNKLILDRVYRLFREPLLHYAQTILENEADAEDAVQQSFLYLMQHPEGIRSVNSPETLHYLSVIVKHQALDMIRKRGREVALEELPEGSYRQSFPEPGAMPLERAMLKLPEKMRELLILRYSDELRPKEIAALLEMKPDTVRRTLHRARGALKKLLRAEKEESEK